MNRDSRVAVFSFCFASDYNLGGMALGSTNTANLPGKSWSAGEIYLEMKRRLDNGARAAMATVVKTRGSTPQQIGAKMVIFDDGSFIGTVGGGCVEADIWAEAREVLRTGKTDLFHFNLNDEYANAEGMVCGGQMDVLIERWSYDDRVRLNVPRRLYEPLWNGLVRFTDEQHGRPGASLPDRLQQFHDTRNTFSL